MVDVIPGECPAMSSINNASVARPEPGFLLWYLLIMVGCAVSICCAYNRRFGRLRNNRDSRDEQSDVNNDVILAVIQNRQDNRRKQRKKQTDRLTALLRPCTVVRVHGHCTVYDNIGTHIYLTCCIVQPLKPTF